MERWFPYSRVETSQEEIEVFDSHYSSFDTPGSIFLLSAKFISNDGKVLMSTHPFLLFYKFHEGHYWQGKCLFIVDLLCARPGSNCLWDVPPGSQSPHSVILYLKEGSLFWGLGLAFVTVTIERMYRGKNTRAQLFGNMILLFGEGVSTSQKATGYSMVVLNAYALRSLLHAGERLSGDFGLSFPEMILASERESPLYLQTENLIHLKSKSCIGRKKWVEYQ